MQPEDEHTIHVHAQASGEARIYQAAKNLYLEHHVHYEHGTRRVESTATTEVCPYPTGLAAFRAEDAEWFFGRDQLIAQLIERLDSRARDGGDPLVVVAPSGAGKSSLLQAGLIHRLVKGALTGSQHWPGLLLTPTAWPVTALGSQIAALTNADPAEVAAEITKAPDQCVERVRALLRMRMKQAGAADMRLVVIVDQMEELFTMCTDERQPHIFLDMISRLTSNSPCGQEPVAVAAYGLRADFYPHCTEYLQLRTALQGGQVILGPMSPEELRAAILNPAERAGLRVDPALVEVLLQELGATAAEGYETGRLPLLAYALRAAWRERHGNTLTVEGYRLTGGIQNAVATTAERALTSLNHAEQQVARMLFLQLVKIGEGTEDTRRRVAHKDLLSGGVEQQTMSRVLDEFTRARLITQGQDTVQITHEALLRAWPTLCSWIDDDRPGNLIRQQLNEAAAQWNHDKRDAGALYRGTRLQAARDWMSSQPQQHDLPPTAAAFLSASIRNERRDTRRRRRTLAALSFLTVISLIASVIAVWQLNTAQAARDDAIINQINAQADRLRGSDVSGTDPSLAAQLKLTVYRKRNNDPNLYTSLISAENVPLSTLLTGHTHGINSVVFSPDGKTLASGSNDHTVQLWRITDPARPTPLGRYTNSQDRNIISLAFSPNGQALAHSDDGGGVELWNVTDPNQPAFRGLPTDIGDVVWSVAFSPDGKTLAGGNGGGILQLWDVTDSAQPTLLSKWEGHHSTYVWSVAFSPDGKTLASGSSKRTIRLWNVDDPEHPTELGQPLTGHTDGLSSVAFSHDGKTLASGSNDHTVRLWNVTDPAHPTDWGQPLTGHTDTVKSVAFSPDGKTLASGSIDGTVRLWNITDPAQPRPLGQPLTGHTDAVTSVAFSPDGKTLASGSNDRTVRLWNIPDTLLTGHTNAVTSVAFSPDGKTLASGSNDRTVRLWNITNPAQPTPLGQLPTGHTDAVTSVAFSRDGKTLASGSNDRTVRLWNVTDPAHPTAWGPPLDSGDGFGSVWSMVFSPDGRTLATGSNDRTMRLWNVTDPAHPTAWGPPLDSGDGFGSVWSMVFSPDGRTLATGGDSLVQLWDVTDPARPAELGKPLTGFIAAVYSLAFSPDSKTLAGGSADATVRLWNVEDREYPVASSRLTGATHDVNSVAFSPDGKTLASGNDNQTVRLWNVEEPKHPVALGQLTGHTDAVTSVAFSHDGKTLASGSGDRTVRLWGLEIDQAIQRICTTTRNTLTPEVWQQYVSIPFEPPCPTS